MTIFVARCRWTATAMAIVAISLLATARGWTTTEFVVCLRRSTTQLAANLDEVSNTNNSANDNTNSNTNANTNANANANANNHASNHAAYDPSRRTWLATAAASAMGSLFVDPSNANTNTNTNTNANPLPTEDRRGYSLRFPTLFDPLYGPSSRKTIKRSLDASGSDSDAGTIWALEQNLELGPLQTPLRCTVIMLRDGTLWVHAPVAPTQEFFELVESCGVQDSTVAHLVVPTYALEHKVFAKDCLQRWPDAQLWTSQGQFSFPWRGVGDELVFGKAVDGVLGNAQTPQPPWRDEIDYRTLEGGTFSIGGTPTTLSETAFFHKATKTLIVTDSVARISADVPPLNDPDRLLLVSKRSTSDPMPEDTPEARLAGWKKTALLVSYFFPEHEELDPDRPGTVVWTDGWEDNFAALSEQLIVPPVVRTLIYAQNPSRVKEWVDDVATIWDFEKIVPAHFEAPIAAGPSDLRRAFRFLDDPALDAFPENDLARGLKPIADLALNRL